VFSETGGLSVTNNTQGLNIISLSLAHGLDDIIETVLDKSRDVAEAVTGRDAKGRTALHHFVERGDVERLRRYAGHYRADCDSDLSECSLLMCACKSAEEKQLDVVRYLVDELHVS